MLLVAQHMRASDLVVALTAVAALMPLLTIILEEEQVMTCTNVSCQSQRVTRLFFRVLDWCCCFASFQTTVHLCASEIGCPQAACTPC